MQEPPSTPTPSSRKRTSPDDTGSPIVSWQSQKRAKHEDEAVEEHPGQLMSQGSTSESIDAIGDSLNTSARVSDEGPLSMSQETICSENSEELSADSVARKLRFFNQLPAYIRKLERRKVAAEMSRDAKARKIVHLEAEVVRLKEREEELEELVALLESARR